MADDSQSQPHSTRYTFKGLTEEQVLAKCASATTLDEQHEWMAGLEQIRTLSRNDAEHALDFDWGGLSSTARAEYEPDMDRFGARLKVYPMTVQSHTASTDWLGEQEFVTNADGALVGDQKIAHRMRASAQQWFTKNASLLQGDHEEFAAQATREAQLSAVAACGPTPESQQMASVFLDHLAHVVRTSAVEGEKKSPQPAFTGQKIAAQHTADGTLSKDDQSYFSQFTQAHQNCDHINGDCKVSDGDPMKDYNVPSKSGSQNSSILDTYQQESTMPQHQSALDRAIAFVTGGRKVEADFGDNDQWGQADEVADPGKNYFDGQDGLPVGVSPSKADTTFDTNTLGGGDNNGGDPKSVNTENGDTSPSMSEGSTPEKSGSEGDQNPLFNDTSVTNSGSDTSWTDPLPTGGTGNAATGGGKQGTRTVVSFTYEDNKALDEQYGTGEDSPLHSKNRFPEEWAKDQKKGSRRTTAGVRDEYDDKGEGISLTIWGGGFSSEYYGAADWNGSGYTVKPEYGQPFTVECPQRGDDTWEQVDDAIMAAVNAHKTASRRTAATCSCAHYDDGSVSPMLCPLHAPQDPCATMAQVTGKRRKGSIVNGTCTSCGWEESGAHTASRRTADSDVKWACKTCGAEAPVGIGYVINDPSSHTFPAPDPSCAGPHIGDDKKTSSLAATAAATTIDTSDTDQPCTACGAPGGYVVKNPAISADVMPEGGVPACRAHVGDVATNVHTFAPNKESLLATSAMDSFFAAMSENEQGIAMYAGQAEAGFFAPPKAKAPGTYTHAPEQNLQQRVKMDQMRSKVPGAQDAHREDEVAAGEAKTDVQHGTPGYSHFGSIGSTCKWCHMPIEKDSDGGWIDPEATGDDSIWRETCPDHDTFTAEHEPQDGTTASRVSPSWWPKTAEDVDSTDGDGTKSSDGEGAGIDMGAEPEGDHSESPLQPAQSGDLDKSTWGGDPDSLDTGGTGNAVTGTLPEGAPQNGMTASLARSLANASQEVQIFAAAMAQCTGPDAKVGDYTGRQIAALLIEQATLPENLRAALKAGENPFVRRASRKEAGDGPWRCSRCGDAVTREGNEWVGSDGEVDCPMGMGPHGPVVPDDDNEYQTDEDGTYYKVSSRKVGSRRTANRAFATDGMTDKEIHDRLIKEDRENGTDAASPLSHANNCPIPGHQSGSQPYHASRRTAASDTGSCKVCGAPVSYDSSTKSWSHDNEADDATGGPHKAAPGGQSMGSRTAADNASSSNRRGSKSPSKRTLGSLTFDASRLVAADAPRPTKAMNTVTRQTQQMDVAYLLPDRKTYFFTPDGEGRIYYDTYDELVDNIGEPEQIVALDKAPTD